MAARRAKSRTRLDRTLLERAARTLRVLAHPVRLRIVELLLVESVSVGELAAAVRLPAAAVSQHLNIMRAHGIVEAQRDGRQVYYRVTSPQAEALVDCMKRNADRI